MQQNNKKKGKERNNAPTFIISKSVAEIALIQISINEYHFWWAITITPNKCICTASKPKSNRIKIGRWRYKKMCCICIEHNNRHDSFRKLNFFLFFFQSSISNVQHKLANIHSVCISFALIVSMSWPQSNNNKTK